MPSLIPFADGETLCEPVATSLRVALARRPASDELKQLETGQIALCRASYMTSSVSNHICSVCSWQELSSCGWSAFLSP